MRSENGSAESYHGGRFESQGLSVNRALFLPIKSHRVLHEKIPYKRILGETSPFLHNSDALFRDETVAEFERIRGSDLDRIAGESEQSWIERLNIFNGAARTPLSLLIFMTLVPDWNLSIEQAIAAMNRLVKNVVAPWCNRYSYATHVKAGKINPYKLDRHYLLSLKCRDAIDLVIQGLNQFGDKMYNFEFAPLYDVREASVNYLTKQLRGDIADNVLARSSGLRLIGYSRDFPKRVMSRYSSNEPFGRNHRRILRLVALEHGIRTEEQYWASSVLTQRKLNYEAHVRNVDFWQHIAS